MKVINSKNMLEIRDFPWCLFVASFILLLLSFFVLYKQDYNNFALVLLMALFLIAYIKSRVFVLNESNKTFTFTEKSMLKKYHKHGIFEDIEDVSVHYGRGRTVIPSGFIVVTLKNKETMRLNELGGCLFIDNRNGEIVKALQSFITHKLD